MKATSDRILTAIYCDDIRREIGGKMSFMGCYESQLSVESMPIALPKLCIFATAITPISRPIRSLTFRVMLDEIDEVAQFVVSQDRLAMTQNEQDETITAQNVHAVMMFSPFIVEKPSALRVVAETEEGQIIGPRLLLRVDPSLITSEDALAI